MQKLTYKSKASHIPQALSSIKFNEAQFPFIVEGSVVWLPLDDFWIKVDLTDNTVEVGAYEG